MKGVSSLTNLTVVGTNTCSTGTTFAENKGKIVIPKQCLSDQDVMVFLCYFTFMIFRNIIDYQP